MKAIKVYELLKNKEIKASAIIDVRNNYETKNGKINGSNNVPLDKLLKTPSKYLKKGEVYYLICQSGSRSLSAWMNLKIKGYKVKNISGGYSRWKKLSI